MSTHTRSRSTSRAGSSLFTLHTLWPLVFMWAVSHKKGEAARVLVSTDGEKPDLATRLAELEARLKSLETK